MIRRGLGIAVAALVLASPARAQVGAPLMLTPPAGEVVVPETPVDPNSREGIAAAPLAVLAPDAMGLVDARSGGFPDTLWDQTSADAARAALEQLPQHFTTLSARRLAQRFLLSAARPPRGTEIGSEAATAGGTLLEARANALAAMGLWRDTLALVELVPADQRDAVLRHLRTDALLVTDKVETACGDARTGVRDAPDDPYWQKVMVLCQYANAQPAAANLAMGVMREQGVVDPLFFWAADAIEGRTGPPPDSLIAPGRAVPPLVLAMLRQAARPLPSEVLATRDPAALVVAAQIAAKAPDENNLGLLEQAVRAGMADPETLRKAYAAMTLEGAGEAAQIAMATPLERAATYQLAVAQTDPNSRAEVIARAWDLARPQDGKSAPVPPVAVALTYAPLVRSLPQSEERVWFAGTAVRILLGAQNATLAGAGEPDLRMPLKAWLDLAEGFSTSSSENATVNAKLWFYRHLMTGGPVTAEALQPWRTALGEISSEQADAKQAQALSLLAAVGDNVSLTAWQPFIGDAASAPTPALPPALWHAADSAARAGHIGEAVVLALRFMDVWDSGSAAMLSAGKAMETLGAIGREADARAIAAEIAIQRGL